MTPADLRILERALEHWLLCTPHEIGESMRILALLEHVIRMKLEAEVQPPKDG